MKPVLTLHRAVAIVALACAANALTAQSNPAARVIPFTENFGTTTFISAPAGFGAWNGLSGATINTQALAEASVPAGNASITAATAAQTTAGVYGFATGGNARFYVQTSGNATNGVNQMVMALNTTGYVGVQVSYDVEIISAQPRTIGIVAQYRVGTSGSWTTIVPTSGSNPYSQAGGTTGYKTTAVATLPSACDNQAVVQVRWALWRGTETGNSSGVAIDNVEVDGTPLGGPLINCNPSSLSFGSVGIGFTSTLTFDASGSNLTPASGDLTITAPGGTDYEVSPDNSTWSTSFNIPYTGGSLSATMVYVRFSPAAIGPQNGNVAVSGGGATTFNVPVSGTGVGQQLYWNFAWATPTFNFIPNISSGDLGRGNNNGTGPDLITTVSPSTGYTGASGSGNAGAACLTGAFDAGTSTYFTFTLTPASGYGMVIQAINFGSRSTGTGPQSFDVRWSLDSYGTQLMGSSMPNDNTWNLYVNDNYNYISPADVPVTFRIYGYDGTGSASPGTANWRIDDLQVLGLALQPAAVWYSRGSGLVTEAIWSDTPAGTAGPGLFTATSSMVVQAGDFVFIDVNTDVDDLTVVSTAQLAIDQERSLGVYGDLITFDGTLNPGFDGELKIVGSSPVALNTAGSVELFDLTVNAASGVVLSGDWQVRGTLEIADGDFDASGASVAITSDATRTGRLGPVGATAGYTGNLTVQRYIPGGVTNWRLLGSSVTGATVAQWNDDFFTAGFPGSDYPNFYVEDELWPSIRKYDETNTGTTLDDGLIGVASTAETLQIGRGYAAWCGDNLNTTAPFTVDITGPPTIAITPVDLPVTWTDTSTPTVDGWNLVSNPVASPVSFGSFSLGDDMTDGYYIYDPVSGNSAFWDEDSQSSTPEDAQLNGIIQSSQAFWLKANGSDASASLGEGAKVSGQGGGLFGGLTVPTLPSVRLRIAAVNGMYDEARVLFANGTPALDNKDALKLNFAHNQAPRIATRSSDGHDLIVNRHGEVTTAVSIPVVVRAAVSGTFTIQLFSGAMPGLQCVVLEDLVTGEVVPVVDGAMHTFTLETTAEPVADRFVLHVGAPLGFALQDALCADAAGTASVDLGSTTTDVVWANAQGQPLSTQPGVTGTVMSPALMAGVYTVFVETDGACGTLWQDFTIAAPFALETDVEVTAASCPLSPDGLVSVGVLGGSAPYTFAWSTGGNGQSVAVAAGTYTLTVTDDNGCTLEETFIVEAMEEAPAAAFEVEGTPVAGQPVQFINTTVDGESWFWDFGDGSTSTDSAPVHLYALPGTYTVALTASNGLCEDISSVDVVVQVGTSAAAMVKPGTRVWSDAQGFVIEHALEGAVHVEVLDATGRLHVQRQYTSSAGRLIVPAAGLNTGIWFVRLTHEGQPATFRVPVLR